MRARHFRLRLRIAGAALSWLLCLVAVGPAACAPGPQALVASGDQYAARRQYREAALEYRRALERDPRSSEAHLGLARMGEQVGDTTLALREYVRAADLLPGSDETQLKACHYLLHAAQFKDAERRAEEVLGRNANNADALALAGLAKAGLRDLDGALTDVMEAIRLDPDRARLISAPPLLQLPRGKPEDGDKAIRGALKVSPDSVVARLAQVNLYWSTGHGEELERMLLDILALDPANETTNRALGTFYVSAGRAPEAEPYFKALAASSADVRAQFALADYYAFAGRNDEALKVLDPLSVRTDTSSAAWIRIASIQYRENKVAEAHKTIDTVIAREKSNQGALLVKGRFLLTEKKPDEALVWLKAAVTIDPRSASAQCLLGSGLEANGQRDEAIKAYSEAVTLNPRLVAAGLRLARLQLGTGAADAAVESARRAIGLEPGSLQAHLLLVTAYLARRDFDLAASELNTLAGQYPDAADVHVQLGTLLRLRQDARGARSAFARALALDPDSFSALAGLVALDLSQKNVKGASTLVETRLAHAPADARVLLLAARVAAASGDAARAEQSLLKAIEADPASLDAYSMLGRLYLSQNRLDRALARFEAIVKRQPNSVPGLTMIGLILQSQNRVAEARRRYDRVLEIDPRAPVASANLAVMLADSDENLDVALQLAQIAKERLPDSAEISYTLGWIYFRKGLWPLAISAFLQAADQVPDNPLYHMRLGLAYLKAGDSANAKARLEKALTLNPNFPEAGEARRALTSMQG